MGNVLLYIIPVLIWGSTWLVIKFQLGVVDPMVSVAYRFFLASVILFIICKFRKLNLKYNRMEHLFMALQGFFLFGVNYWLVYVAELTITSGLVAIVFSTIVFLNSLNASLFLKMPIQMRVIAGGVLGFSGIMLLFKDELLAFNLSSGSTLALGIALISAFLASIGNIISARNQKRHLPVIQNNAFSMLYGSLLMMGVAFVWGKPFNFDFSMSYILSLSYLVIFGSVVAFGSYLKLIGNIGPEKAANATLVIPIIALFFSTVFEDYHLTLFAVIGIVLVLSGNFLALKKKQA